MDRLTAAKVFIDVATTNSFTATADRLEMSRPMVTRYIDAMESWLNVRLLNRTTRKVSLTTAGEQCLSEVELWVEQAEGLQHRLLNRDELRGKIRLATSMSFGFSQLIPAVNSFLAEHPQVEIDIDVQDRAADLVTERIDLAIRIAANPDPSLIGRRIGHCESVLVASPRYLQQAGEIHAPSDLAQHRCLGYKNFDRHVWNLTRGSEQAAVEVHCALTANEATTLLSAAMLDMGVSMQPTYLVTSALERGELVQVLPQWQPTTMDIYALYPSRKHLAPAVRSLIDHLFDYFKHNKWQNIRL